MEDICVFMNNVHLRV